LPTGLKYPSSLSHLWVFAPFWNAKTTIYGPSEPLVQWSLQSKQAPMALSAFGAFEILRAKRDKLLSRSRKISGGSEKEDQEKGCFLSC
jgi:hypothetical protein